MSHPAVFLHQMFNLSALLLYDAFLKCVVAGVVLCSIVALKTLTILQGNVATHMSFGGIFSHNIITNFFLILTRK